MMRATLLRHASTDQGTFGRLALELPGGAKRSWCTIELPWRGNARGLSCIRADTYRAQAVDSPRFKRQVYRLENKNGREDVEIHVLNFAGDAGLGWRTQAHGCIGLGLSVGALDNGDGALQQCVLQSSAALTQLLERTKGVDLELEVLWAEGAVPSDNPNPEAHAVSKITLQGSST